MKKYLADYAFLLTIAGAIVLLDQLSKYVVRGSLGVTEFWSPWPWLAPYARIVHWQNTGAAFGMFQNLSGLFAILAVIVSGVIVYYFPQVPRDDWVLRLALSLQLGGAMGNLIDRVTRGGVVTDFISLGSFAVFNVADASISIGVVILVISMWTRDRKKPSDAANPSPTEGTAAPENSSSQPEELRSE